MVVRSALVLSEYIPVALNCCVVLLGMLGVIGVITREVRVLDDTVSVVLFDIIPDVAVMVEAPAEKPVASPSSLIVATDVFEELQATADVISPWVLFEYVPVAENCWVVPFGMTASAGVIWDMDVSVADVTVSVVLPEINPK